LCGGIVEEISGKVGAMTNRSLKSCAIALLCLSSCGVSLAESLDRPGEVSPSGRGQSSCNTKEVEVESRHWPWLSRSEATTPLSAFSVQEVSAAIEWLPLKITGWPGWDALDLADLRPLPSYSLLGWVGRIENIFVTGSGPPLDATETQVVAAVTNKVVHATTGPATIEQTGNEREIQLLWLHRLRGGIDLPEGSCASVKTLWLQPQDLAVNREVVHRVNGVLGDGRIKKIYVDYRWMHVSDEL